MQVIKTCDFPCFFKSENNRKKISNSRKKKKEKASILWILVAINSIVKKLSYILQKKMMGYSLLDIIYI